MRKEGRPNKETGEGVSSQVRRKSVKDRSQVKVVFQERGNNQLLKWLHRSSSLRTGFGNMKVIGDLDKRSLREVTGIKGFKYHKELIYR